MSNTMPNEKVNDLYYNTFVLCQYNVHDAYYVLILCLSVYCTLLPWVCCVALPCLFV